jgi:protoporphyrinogen oxidase
MIASVESRVAVIGAGVSGLAAGWYLSRRGSARAMLLEASPRPGGKVRTLRLAGLPVEAGPDGFLAEPAAIALCEAVGLGGALVASSTSEAQLWEDRGLRPLQAEDMPRAQGAPPRLLSIRGGMERLVGALHWSLGAAGVRLCVRAAGVDRAAGGRFLVRVEGRAAIRAHRVVLAVPAPAAAELLSPLLPDVAAALRRVRYRDLAVINLVYPGRPWTLRGSGLLAREEPGRLISGCTWLSSKWPHLAAGDLTAVRVTVGGHDGSDWGAMPDAELIAGVRRELAQILGPGPEPAVARVARWPGAVADPRRLDRDLVRSAQRAAAEAGVLLAAGGYLGGGVASCIADAELAAEAAAG